jgi:pyrroloquinoline quinone (PQQ) biosynthesis protein C
MRALDDRVGDVEADVHTEEFWRMLVTEPAGVRYTRAMLRETMLRTYWYQPQTTEAGFHMLGRFPKAENHWLRALLNHKAEEAEHGNWALRDYLALGGTPQLAEQGPSPATFAVAAVWWHMARVANPLGYLGAEYLFEELTARVTRDLIGALETTGSTGEGFGFVIDHAREDVKHANLIRHLVGEVVTKHPSAEREIVASFDRFLHVYPLPVWREAHAGVIQE